jgi:hypothetical protein
MRARTSIAVLAAGAAALVLAGWTGGLAPHASLFADNRPGAVVVDAELVIAVDVSNSMDPEEQALQREGYILGLTSREFLNALRSGINGKIAVTYFEWAYDQKIVMPWRLIDGPETAEAVAKEIAAAPYRRAPRTSIYGALQFAKPLFDTSGYHGLRRIIDAQPALRLRNRHRQSRRLLRGLRHRRPRRLRHRHPRARPVQGGDPHQAGAGDRRPDAAADSGAGNPAAAGLLPVKAARLSVQVGDHRIGAEVGPSGMSRAVARFDTMLSRHCEYSGVPY